MKELKLDKKEREFLMGLLQNNSDKNAQKLACTVKRS